MDQKKRRNSILKKPSATDDENTGEITTKLKRRISFSGKKSVKEFLAGEEQATIWGTSYEESAEFMHANTTESAVVGVNDKRIVLRNRKVVVDTNPSNKRRSRKHVHVAENDKENVFIPTPQVENKDTKAPAPIETVSDVDPSVSSELALVKSEVQNVITAKGQRDPLNTFCTTFDFINYSGAVNKSVTIEQSVDVSLDENELQMYKFRVPVSSQDVSPNLSVCRDGSSPNIFSHSILMTDEEMNMLKLMKVQMGGLISKGETLKMIEPAKAQATSEAKPGAFNPLGERQAKVTTAIADMDMVKAVADAGGKSQETKSLKRKTIRAVTDMDQTSIGPETALQSHVTIVDMVAMDVHSPLRKKPMHNKHMNKTMDISAVTADEQAGPPPGQTIYFEVGDIDETIREEEKPNERSVFRQTIHFDQNQIHEDTICQESDASPTTAEADLPMELSLIGVENEGDMPAEVGAKTAKKRQSIRGPVDMLEDSPNKNTKGVDKGKFNMHQKSIYSQITIVEDSPTQQKLPQSKRESVYTPTDIVEESPKPTKDFQIPKPKGHQTVSNNDIVPDVNMSVAVSNSAKASSNEVAVRSIARKTILAAVGMDLDTRLEETSTKGQKSNQRDLGMVVPLDMDVENKMKATGRGASFRNQDGMHAPSDTMDKRSTFTKSIPEGRKSICAPTDIVEDSRRIEKTRTMESVGNDRKSIYAPTSMIEDSPNSDVAPKEHEINRKSIYMLSMMMDESPGGDRQVKSRANNRKSIHTSSDMVEVSPKMQKATEVHKANDNVALGPLANPRKSIYTTSDMIDDSPKSKTFAKPVLPCTHPIDRKSIYNPAEMDEDSPKSLRPVENYQNYKCVMKSKKSIYTTTDIVEDSTVPQNIAASGRTSRRSIYDPVDMMEDSPPKGLKLADVPTHVDVQSFKNSVKDQTSIYNPTDMMEHSFELSETGELHPKSSCTSSDVHRPQRMFESSASVAVEDKPRSQPVESKFKVSRDEYNTNVKSSYLLESSLTKAISRQTIYDNAEILEDSPTKLPTDAGNTYSTHFPKAPSNTSQSISISKVSTHQENQLESPGPKAAVRKTICASTDIPEDSPTTKVRHSIYTPVDIVECSPKRPEPHPAAAAAPKIIVRHMTLQQGLLGENAAMRVLQKQQTKAKFEEPVQVNDTALEMSIEESAPVRTSPSSFLRLNEKLIRGEVKSLAEDHKSKKSLFDRLEVIEADVPKFDSFQKKSNAVTGYHVQPRKSTVNDYTIEFTSHTFDGQRRKGNDYTMDMSTGMQKQDDLTNVSLQMSPIPIVVPEEKVQPTKSEQSERQTMYITDKNRMDLSGSAPSQEVAKAQSSRKTIHFDEHVELDTSHTQTNSNQPVVTVFEKNSRTIHFNENNQIEETKPMPTVRVPQTAQDISSMDMSGTDRLQNLMRQSCIMRPSSLDTGTQSIEQSMPAPYPKTVCAPVAFCEDTKCQVNEQQNATMDLSTSICPQFVEPMSRNQESRPESTSAGRQRRTIHCNDDLELDTAHVSHMPHQEPEVEKPTARERLRASGIPTRIAGRNTIHFNQDLELDDDKTGQVIEKFRKCTARQTVYTQQSIDIDESLTVPPCAAKADVSKVLPKPRRMTTFDELPIDVDEVTEKLTMRKSSFSRTLNFNEVTRATNKLQSIEYNDSPLYRPKLKRCESTTEIDRSLAEYLKAEAAATLYGCSLANMAVDVAEQSSHSEYYDAEAEQVERDQFIVEQQDDQKPAPILEESGMQPFQRTTSKRDIEESVLDERARNPDEPEPELPDMSFEPRSVLANRLNHEFFDKEVSMSPKPEEPEESGQNAVDESFFDENISKPAAAASTKIQNNRHTIYFNESENVIDAMDISISQEDKAETKIQSPIIGRSKGAQSMKEILRESNMLFTQSMLKPHFFETKQSTVYFNAKDISLDTVPVSEALSQQKDNVECTPTKANKSRIPQLIGSAKKLQSMKKSMEFTQQKLTNLSCSVLAREEDTASQQKDQTAEEHNFSCEPKQIHDSFETVEIPRKMVSTESKKLQESFETVEIPRRATTSQRNDTLYLCQNEVDLTNISQKSNYRFEDVPITISDVSTYFTQRPPPSSQPANEQTCSPNTTEALCNLDIYKLTDEIHPKSNDSDDTTYNFAKFRKRYVELTSDSITSTGLEDDIEKTHLSLVNTLDEHESEVVRDTCSEQLQAVVPPPLETTKFSTSVCRKCKGDKRPNDTALESFELPPLREYKMNLEALRQLGNKPRLFTVANIWRHNLRESDSFHHSDDGSAFDLEDDDAVENFIASLDKKRAGRQRQKKEFKQESSFVYRVQKKLQSQKTNWILSDLLLMQNILKFTHTRIRTFAIFITFTPKDARGIEVEFNEMRVLPNDHYRTWAPFDYVLHYQTLVELPFNLIAHFPTSENLFQLLEHVENVTQDVLKTGKDMMFQILTSPAKLMRDTAGAVYIQKFVRTKTPQNEVKCKEFQIEVMNMKRLSYKSITMPPLCEFDEKIQLMPTGPNFLRVFLADPLRYLKT